MGPIPSASSFEAYRAVRADLPDIIIDTWQKDAQARRNSTETDAKVKSRLAILEYIKVIIVALFAFGMLGLAIFLAIKGEYQLAVGLVVSPIVVAIIDAYRQK